MNKLSTEHDAMNVDVTPRSTVNTETKGQGLRFNAGKPRYDLVPAYAQDQYVKVLTAGANKYADRNWENGMSWSKVIASLKRHIAKFEMGEDIDEETGCFHTALMMCNAAFLTEYYRIFPQGDDRPHGYLRRPKIGLDIDEVLCDFVAGWEKKFGKHSHLKDEVIHWDFCYSTGARFKGMSPEEAEEFFLGLEPKIKSEDMPFEPHCYITSRSIPAELTQTWLQLHGFPTVKVYSIGHGQSKVDIAKQSGIDIFVDDRFENFVELNNAGICCYLMDAPHNRKYNVGYKRIKSLKELV